MRKRTKMIIISPKNELGMEAILASSKCELLRMSSLFKTTRTKELLQSEETTARLS
jgi:hypothetical protein